MFNNIYGKVFGQRSEEREDGEEENKQFEYVYLKACHMDSDSKEEEEEEEKSQSEELKEDDIAKEEEEKKKSQSEELKENDNAREQEEEERKKSRSEELKGKVLSPPKMDLASVFLQLPKASSEEENILFLSLADPRLPLVEKFKIFFQFLFIGGKLISLKNLNLAGTLLQLHTGKVHSPQKMELARTSLQLHRASTEEENILFSSLADPSLPREEKLRIFFRFLLFEGKLISLKNLNLAGTLLQLHTGDPGSGDSLEVREDFPESQPDQGDPGGGDSLQGAPGGGDSLKGAPGGGDSLKVCEGLPESEPDPGDPGGADLLEEGGETQCDENEWKALVFQGGGAKGIAYCGAVQVLYKNGILGQIKRFGGASAGAICAAFLAIGFSSEELNNLLSTDFQKLLMGDRWYDKNKCTKVVFRLWEFIRKFGLFSTSSFYEWLGEEFEKKIKDLPDIDKMLQPGMNRKDITFKQVYTLFGKELCIIVTDVCTQTEEYYHPKTTPNLPVREAVLMSMSIPFLFHPKTRKVPVCDEDEYFIDGGVTCNFPLHCFDGWWLSMETDHSFTAKLKETKGEDLLKLRTERFKSEKSETLGVRVMSEKDIIQEETNNPTGKVKKKTGKDPPDTKLARKKSGDNKKSNSGITKYEFIEKFLKVLDRGETKDGCTSISRGTICKELQDEAPNLAMILRKRKAKSIARDGETESDGENKEKTRGLWAWLNMIKEKTLGWSLKKEEEEGDENDEIVVTFEDIESAFLEITNRPFAEWTTNIPRRAIKNIKEYTYGVASMLKIEGKPTSNYTEAHGLCHKITIKTVHVDTTDFDLEEKDKEFLISKGEEATTAFLNSLKKEKGKEATTPSKDKHKDGLKIKK